MKRPKFFLLNLSGIGCRSTRKMVAQSYLSKGHQSRYQILFGSVCIPLEIKCKVALRQEIISSHETTNQWKTGLPGVSDSESGLPGKTSLCKTYIFYLAEAFKR